MSLSFPPFSLLLHLYCVVYQMLSHSWKFILALRCYFTVYSFIYTEYQIILLGHSWRLPYLIIADETQEFAVKVDMIDEDNKNNKEEAMIVRALYIIGPDHKLRLSMLYPSSTGRNVEWLNFHFCLSIVQTLTQPQDQILLYQYARLYYFLAIILIIYQYL